MKITIFCENKKLSKNYQSAISEYIKRLSPYCNISTETYKEKSIKSDDYIILVNTNYESIPSETLAEKIKYITTYENSKISIVLSNNVSKEIIDISNDFFSLSNFDLTNETSQILMIEQIYRAFAIINGKKYHK